ncbi:hypothetical protein HELRODRAFT_150188, partial [Helobdella robusta]|uniref:Uncharacterized protein n=1 Tax=Helobdella robusta TaxID=6412 RepID=T1EKE7_HELRO
CAGCGEKITDSRYLLSVVNKQWHLTCLVCSACKLPLNPEVTCYAKDDEIYCKDDYYRRFAPKTCSCCQSNISSDQLVMRVRDRIYHLHCFVCSVCSKQLTTGEPFGYNSDDNSLFCKLHYETYHVAYSRPLCCESANPSTGVCFLHTPIPHHQHLLGSMVHHQTANLQKGRPRKRKSVMTDVEHFVPNLEMNQDEAMLQHQRQKRMRTSFKHHQLRIMKSYFSLNHNPDSKDLKQLAQKTGLSKRVLQVWFQNARAKHRRTAIKDRD